MSVQRIIASVLLSVLFLTPLAPALVPQGLAVPSHCVRPPLSRASDSAGAPSSRMAGMHCHEGMQHAMAQSAPSADDSNSASPHQLQSNGCCNSHECCNSTVRSQWAHSTDRAALGTSEPIHIFSAPPSVPGPQSPQFHLARGRAPPACS